MIFMHKLTAYHRREAVTANDLERLKSALMDDVSRYREAIRGYNADKMRRFGEPYLAKLQAKVDEVSRLQAGCSSET